MDLERFRLRRFLDSLPPFARTRNVEDVEAFFAPESALT